jgi:1-acyl-sn-glycerol-3-phosphate acyltransferase
MVQKQVENIRKEEIVKVFDRMRAWFGLALGLLGTVALAFLTIVLSGIYYLVIGWWMPFGNPFRHAPRLWGIYIRYVVLGGVMGWSVKEHGEPPVLPGGGLIPVIANHFTNAELPLLTWYIYSRLKMRVLVIMKKENRWTLFGWWTIAVGAAIFIDRTDKRSSEAVIGREIARAKELGEMLVILSFLEGTRPTRAKIGSRSKRLGLRYLMDPKGGGLIKILGDIGRGDKPVAVVDITAFSTPREATFGSLSRTGLVYHITSKVCQFIPNNPDEIYETINGLWRKKDAIIAQAETET